MSTKLPTNAELVAYYFLKKAKENNRPITNKALQKLVYYAQVWHYTIFNEKLFKEKIEAWVHGPAIPSLYEKFKSFQASPILLDLSDVNISFSGKEKEFLDEVWKVYGHLDGDSLEALTHAELPWQEARKGLSVSDSSQNEISLKVAKEFYGAKLNQ